MNDHPTGELRFSRVFDAPRELVFACMTRPEHLARFWGPTGTHAPAEHIRVDLRVGGAFETTMVKDSDGSAYPTRATYLEVTAPTRLVWRESHSGMTVSLTFLELADARTEVEIVQTAVPEAAMQPGARAGFQTALDRFAAYLNELGGTYG